MCASRFRHSVSGETEAIALCQCEWIGSPISMFVLEYLTRTATARYCTRRTRDGLWSNDGLARPSDYAMFLPRRRLSQQCCTWCFLKRSSLSAKKIT